MDISKLKWLAEEPNSKSPSPISQEPLFTEGNKLDVDSPFLSRDSKDSPNDDETQKHGKYENTLLNTSLKKLSSAKKRLQAFNVDYIHKISMKDNDVLEKEQHDGVFYSDGNVKPQEIEGIEILEDEEHIEKGNGAERARPNISGNLSFSITSRSNSQLPEVVNHFKKRKIKSRNYRQTDNFIQQSTSPGNKFINDEQMSINSTKTSCYPNNWTEYKERLLMNPQNEELKSVPRRDSTSLEKFNKLYKFTSPSTLLEPFKYASEQQIKTVPPFFLRLTKSEPQIVYSINSERNKESYLTRDDLLKIIPKAHVELLQNFISKQSKLQPISRNNSSRSWYNKYWKKSGDQVSKVIENSVGLSFLQNYSDEGEENEIDDIIIYSSVKKNDKQRIDNAESNSERPDQTPPQLLEFSLDMNNPSCHKENSFTEGDICEERLTPQRNPTSFNNLENNDVSLTPKRDDFSQKHTPLYETRMAIHKIEQELGLTQESHEQSGLTKRKKKRHESESKSRDECSEDDGDLFKMRKKKKKRKKSYVEEDSSTSEDEKHKKNKKEKKKDKSNKKKRRNHKEDSNKVKRRSSENKKDHSKPKNKQLDETKLSSGDFSKKKKLRKERHRHYSDNEFLTDEDVSKCDLVNKITGAGELFDTKILKNKPGEIEPDQDLRNLLHQLENRKEKNIEKLENFSMKHNIELIKNKDTKIRESREFSRAYNNSKEMLYSGELFQIGNIKIKQEHNWEDCIETDRKKNSKKKKRDSPNTLDDFPLEKSGQKSLKKFKGGTPDTDESRRNWESDDEITPKRPNNPNTSWESDDEICQTKRLVEKQRDITEIQDLHIPLTFKPFTRREPKIINFKLELPEIPSEVLNPEINKKIEEQSVTINNAIQESGHVQTEVVGDVNIEKTEVTEIKTQSKRRTSEDELPHDHKKSRWDKKVDDEKSVDLSNSIDPVPISESPVETSKVLENEYEEFMKAVSTTTDSVTNTSALNDSVITVSSDSNSSMETPIHNRKLSEMDLGNVSTPIKLDISDEIDVPEAVIAPKDIPFIPMPEEVSLAPNDISFIPMPGENLHVPTTVEIKPVPSPKVIPETISNTSLNLGLLTDIAPVTLKSELYLTLPPKMPLATTVTVTDRSVGNTISTHDSNMKGCETPEKRDEVPVEGRSTPTEDSNTRVRDHEILVEHSETLVKDIVIPTINDETSDRKCKDTDTSVMSNASEGIHSPAKTVEKPFSLVLPLKKTLVIPSLNFGDSDDETDKSKKTIDEIKKENSVALDEIKKNEDKDNKDKPTENANDGKSNVKKKEETRSRSPASKKSATSHEKSRTDKKSSDNHSSSRSKRRESSPRRREVSPKRRDKSPRRRGVSPRRRDSSPKKKGYSPKRNSSPRRRSSPGRRRYSSRKSISPAHRRRSLSPRRKSPKRSTPPRSSSKSSKRPRSRSPKRSESTSKTKDSMDKSNKKRSKPSSNTEGSKKSVADSTISDESLLTQHNLLHVGHSPLVSSYKHDTSKLSNSLVDYSKEQLSSISTTYDNFSYEQNNLPPMMQSIDGFAQSCVTEIPMHSYSKFVQVGNMVQIVPTDLHMKTDYNRTDSYMRNEDNIAQEKKMQIVQVGNMLQIVPTDMPPLPPYPPLPPEEPKNNYSEAFDLKLEQEKLSAETSMKQKVAERRAERDKRRLERETRRKEKERRRREKEKNRQVKLKQKTENMIKRALELEVEGTEDNSLLDEMPIQWPPLPAIVGSSKEGRGILVRGQRTKKSTDSEKKKNVQFADGVRPGEGTSPSAGEELSSPPPSKTLPKEKRYTKTKLGKNKKRKVKVKIIKSIEADISDEEDNLPPPSPPPGSPPPHIFPSRIKPQPTVVSNILPQYVPLPQPVQSSALYRPPTMNVVIGHPTNQLHRAHMPPTPPQRHLHQAETMVHHHGIPPIHLAPPPPPPPPPPPTSGSGTPLGPTHRNISYHYQM